MILGALGIILAIVGVIWEHRSMTNLRIRHIESISPFIDLIAYPDWISNVAIDTMRRYEAHANRNKKLKVALDQFLNKVQARLQYLKTVNQLTGDPI